MPRQSVFAPFRDLVEESFDEAAFLWRRWETELTSPTRNLDEVYWWAEDRLQGALEGAIVGDASAIGLAVKALRSNEPERVAVAAAVLSSIPSDRASAAFTRALARARGPMLHAMLRAVELMAPDRTLRSAAAIFAGAEPVHAAALCRLKTFRRVPPGNELATAFASDDPVIRVEALRAAALADPVRAESYIAAGLNHGHPDVQYAAVESGLLRQVQGAWETALDLGGRRSPAAGRHLNLVALFGGAGEHEVIYQALPVPELQTAAIWALGHVGTVRAIDACVAGMRHEPLARTCGEAFSWMTGIDLEREGLARPKVPDEAPAFEDDDLDASLIPKAEDLWSLPDADAVQRYWQTRRSDWPPNVRRIRGQVASRELLLTSIERGPMLRRSDLVFELRVKTGGRYDVEPRAFAARQRQMMAASRAAVSVPSER